MATRPWLWVDAFTETPMGGNPCAVVLDANGLDDAAMQSFAREMNLSETAFVMRSTRADFRARYFTPDREIPLAGHPTIASLHALWSTGRIELAEDERRFTLELEAGVIDVALAGRRDGSPLVSMHQLAPKFLRSYHADRVAPVFGLTPDDFLDDHPIQTVSTGSPMLLLPLRNHEALRRARLDGERYRALHAEGDFFSPHLFCLGGATEAGDTFARHLGLAPGPVEDPFTGSATGCMAAYLWREGLIARSTFRAEQGHWMQRPGLAEVEVFGARDAIVSVRVSGCAVTIVEGQVNL